MALRRIQLLATESNWRLFMLRKADPAFFLFQQKIYERDRYTCFYCDFCAKDGLEIVNRDANYFNNHVNNLVTACVFCAQCFFLEAIGRGEFGGGTLIYLPEMTQNELNALCHVLFISMMTGGRSATEARNIYRSFRLRSQIIEKQLGEGLSNPALLGQLLVDGRMENIDALNKVLASKIRVLPDASRFSSVIQSWVYQGLNELMFEYS